MGRNGKINQTARMLQRIVAVLYALAKITERAATFPGPVRHAVLWLLLRAIAPSRSLVEEIADEFGFLADVSSHETPNYHDTVNGLLYLALCFDELARTLSTLLAYAGGNEPAGRTCAAHELVRPVAHDLASLVVALRDWAVPGLSFHDTS